MVDNGRPGAYFDQAVAIKGIGRLDINPGRQACDLTAAIHRSNIIPCLGQASGDSPANASTTP